MDYSGGGECVFIVIDTTQVFSWNSVAELNIIQLKIQRSLVSKRLVKKRSKRIWCF
jgi:hypothetical protein